MPGSSSRYSSSPTLCLRIGKSRLRIILCGVLVTLLSLVFCLLVTKGQSVLLLLLPAVIPILFQFLRDKTNLRTDEYGGSPENRTRFMREVLEQLIDVWGADRVGIRLSPNGDSQGTDDSNYGSRKPDRSKPSLSARIDAAWFRESGLLIEALAVVPVWRTLPRVSPPRLRHLD